MIKNNVTRLLDQRKVAYTPFELPVEKLGAQETALILGVQAGVVFKTIVVLRQGKGKPILAVVPGDREVDLKALAAAVGERKLHLPTEREAEQITGLQAGGISPLALYQRGFQTVLDQRGGDYEQIYISGGQRGLSIRLSPRALLELVQGRLADISL